MRETDFQKEIINDLKQTLKGCIIVKNDSGYIQGIPDLLVLYKDKWAALECKVSHATKKQPNQEYYVKLMDEMSFSRFVYPANKEEVLDALQRSFLSERTTRVSRS